VRHIIVATNQRTLSFDLLRKTTLSEVRTSYVALFATKAVDLNFGLIAIAVKHAAQPTPH
jgi:hypothetical protein